MRRALFQSLEQHGEGHESECKLDPDSQRDDLDSRRVIRRTHVMNAAERPERASTQRVQNCRLEPYSGPEAHRSGVQMRSPGDDAPVAELTNKTGHVGMEQVGRDFVFREHRVADAGDRAALHDQLPDARADGVQAVVHARFKIEEDGFAGELATDDRRMYEELIGRSNIHADVTVSRNGCDAPDEGILELSERLQFGARVIRLGGRFERSDAHVIQQTAGRFSGQLECGESRLRQPLHQCLRSIVTRERSDLNDPSIR